MRASLTMLAIACACGSAAAQTPGPQSFAGGDAGCAAAYVALKADIEDDTSARATELMKRFRAAANAFQAAQGLTDKRAKTILTAMALDRVQAREAGNLTQAQLLAEVQACDRRYGYDVTAP
jgi:adenosylmethionine-8-amino-7-oxononanoate aminotransferase